MISDKSIFAVQKTKQAIFLGSDIFRGSVYGKGHPLNIARVWPVIDICRAFGWLDDSCFETVAPASASELQLFHSADYVAALQDAQTHQALDESRRQRHRIGMDNNPIFPQVYDRPATAAAASMRGARYLLEGRYFTVFNPSGGTHHGMPDKANGFCFVNDPALALLTLAERPDVKIAYLDIDAHHPDGVQDTLSSHPRIKLWSVHEENRWPRTGQPGDNGGGQARNFTLPRGADDDAFLTVMTHHILPEIEAFAPDYLVLQAGCDGLSDDPQSGLMFTTTGYWRSIEMCLALAIPTMILGGGGYNPFTTARAWSGVWGLIAGHSPYKADAPHSVQDILTSLEWSHRLARSRPDRWVTRLYD